MLPKPERFVAPQLQSAPNELANEAKSRALPAAKRYARMGSASLGGRARLTRAKAAGAAPVDAGRLVLINSLASFPTEPHAEPGATRPCRSTQGAGHTSARPWCGGPGGTVAARALIRPRTADETVAPRYRAPTRQGQGSRAGSASFGVKDGHLARGLGRPAHVSRPGSRGCGSGPPTATRS